MSTIYWIPIIIAILIAILYIPIPEKKKAEEFS